METEITLTKQTPLPIGTVVQYRKVGIFRVVGYSRFNYGLDSWQGDVHRGRHDLEPIKAPKKYREAGVQSLEVCQKDVIDG